MLDHTNFLLLNERKSYINIVRQNNIGISHLEIGTHAYQS